jgi:ubiquinone/menaquinone biosynthesis C-methylase UbiE
MTKSHHWNEVYGKKAENEVSWYQEIPHQSLRMIQELEPPKNSPVIDIGAGESRLVDHLIVLGFGDITILDLSEVALRKLEQRLGEEKMKAVKLVVSDVTEFKPQTKYALWHDRATFHFLTTISDVEKYLNVVSDAIVDGGFLIVSTFSSSGPDKCSGLPITKYSQDALKSTFNQFFSNVHCFEDTHTTPFQTEQHFVYCGFKKKSGV